MAEIMRKGDWDMVPTVTYSPEREDEMAFTQPFFSTPYVVVSRAENKQKIFSKPVQQSLYLLIIPYGIS